MKDTLHLPLQQKWFEMIASGEKLEEYREIMPYWEARIKDRNTGDFRKFKKVIGTNGYGSTLPKVIWEPGEILVGWGRPEWGAPTDRKVFIIPINKILQLKNYERTNETDRSGDTGK